MPSKNKPSEFDRAISRAKRSRLFNLALCLLGLAGAAGTAWFFRLSEYNYFVWGCAAIAAAVFLALAAKSVREFSAAKRIAQKAVYAARPSTTQKACIKQYLVRRGQTVYFTVLLLALVPPAIVLVAMRHIFDNDVYLLFLAGYALLCLVMTLLASLYLRARLSVRYLIVAISQDGVLLGNEIIPFRAQKHEALELIKFSDYYYLKFIRTGLMGVKFKSRMIFPTDGVLRNGLQGEVDELLARALGMRDLFFTDEAFYESRRYIDMEEHVEKPFD